MGLRNIEFWERLLSDMPASYIEWFEEEKEYLIKNIFNNAKVLEVGCGEGRTIRDIIRKTSNIIAIDHDKKAINDAKKNLKNYSDIKIIKAEAIKLPFKENSFDFVLCMTTFANFGKNKIKALLEMKRVVKKDGYIIISTFSENAFDERIKVYKKFNAPIKEIKGTTVIFDKELKDNISEQFSKEQLLDFFNKVKLKAIDIKKFGIGYICKLKK